MLFRSRHGKFASRGIRAAEGKFLGPYGCGLQARGAAATSPGFTTRQGRLGRTFPERFMAEHVHHACGETSVANTLVSTVRVATKREVAAASTQRLALRVACQVQPGRCQHLAVCDTTQRSARQRERRRHARQPSAASKGVTPGSRGRGMQGRTSEHERFRPAQASGTRRREGSKPKGRDGYDGTGRSPRAWRRRAPTRPEPNLSNAPTHVTG